LQERKGKERSDRNHSGGEQRAWQDWRERKVGETLRNIAGKKALVRYLLRRLTRSCWSEPMHIVQADDGLYMPMKRSMKVWRMALGGLAMPVTLRKLSYNGWHWFATLVC
jgi:hypothetical protein